MASPPASRRHPVISAAIGISGFLAASALALPASADDHGKSADPHGKAQGRAHASSTHDATSHAASAHTSSAHNPPGNNGTVKIHDVAGDLGHHNVPHVDCDFTVAFWGFDAGQTLTVSFTGQAPTGAGTPLTVSGAQTSLTSPDDAGGGQDYDGELLFTADELDLASLGAPHPQQGYHVRLSVDTGAGVPGGAKTKVFWIAPCAPAATASTPAGPTHTGLVTTAAATSAGQSSGGAGLSPMHAITTQRHTPAQVLGTKVTRSGTPATAAAATAPAALPFTGARIAAMTLAAVAALGLGTLLLVSGRRRRRLSLR